MHALLHVLTCLPACCPMLLAGGGARLWWRYAITVVTRQQQSFSSRAWRQLRMVALYHKQYVPAYVRRLQLQAGQAAGAQASAASAAASPQLQQLQQQIAGLDAQLDERVILLFRRMAHAKLRTQQKASAQKQQQPAQQQGWIGWLMGSSAKPSQQAAAATQQPAALASADDYEATMGVDEWNKLEQVVSEQAVSRARAALQFFAASLACFGACCRRHVQPAAALASLLLAVRVHACVPPTCRTAAWT